MPEIHEATPLLVNGKVKGLNRNKRIRNGHKWRKLGILSLMISIIFLISSIIFVSVFYVKPRLGDAISEGISFDLNKVNFLGLQDQNPEEGKEGGLLFGIEGDEHNKFDEIEDITVQRWFKYGGYSIRGLNLRVRALELLFVEDSDKDDSDEVGKLFELGTVQIDPFYVKTQNNATTELDLDVVFWPNALGVGKVLKRFMKDPDSKVRVRGDALVDIYIIKGYVNIGVIRIPLDMEFGGKYINLFY